MCFLRYRSPLYKGSRLIISSWSRTKSQLFIHTAVKHTTRFSALCLSFRSSLCFIKAMRDVMSLLTSCNPHDDIQMSDFSVRRACAKACMCVFGLWEWVTFKDMSKLSLCVSPFQLGAGFFVLITLRHSRLVPKIGLPVDSLIQLAAVNTQIRELSLHPNPPRFVLPCRGTGKVCENRLANSRHSLQDYTCKGNFKPV